jgi:NSS family neurotransmitter:Na+ symporter
VLLTELSIGRKTERNAVGAFKALVPGSWWRFVGGLGIVTGFGILAFYSVVAGWTLAYLWGSLTGQIGGVLTTEESGAIFTGIIGNPVLAVALTAAFLFLTIIIVQRGVSKGIEAVSKILMPLLFIILVILAARSLTLPGGLEGLTYFLTPDFSKITVSVVMSALGQALFSLSLGMGAMITYGSYFPSTENMPLAGVSVAFFDTLIAIIAGFMIFPALFSAGVEPNAGPGLVFVVLPSIFGALPAGNLFAIAFYALLAIAALTSTISLLEVVVAYFVDERDWNRGRAAWLMGAICFVIAVPSALSQGGVDFLTALPGLGMDFLSVQNIIWGNYSLSIGAVLITFFAGWVWGVPKALASLEASGHRLPLHGLWGFLVRYVCPVAVGLVLIFIIWTQQYF